MTSDDGFSNLWRTGHVDQFGPDQVPVMGTQIPSHDSPPGHPLDGRCVERSWDAVELPTLDEISTNS